LLAQADYAPRSLREQVISVQPGRVGKVRPLNKDEELVWRDLARFFVVAPRLLDEDLQRNAGLSLSEYTVLMNLSEVPGSRLRITELANRAYLSGSRMTRLVDKMISEGLVEKCRSAGDGRGVEVTLTDRGLDRLAQAYPAHLLSVRERIMNHVDRKALQGFGFAMRSIVQSFASDGPDEQTA
jgi:DNA-binding MarR family transcriptional regulator